MRRRDVADTVVVLALSVGAALAGRVVGAGPVEVTVAPAALVTVHVAAALRPVRTPEGAVDGAGPVTDGTHGVLEPHVEGESPLAVTERVAVHLRLTGGTLEQAGLSCWATLPESAAVWNIISQKDTQSNNSTYCWSARGSRAPC